MKKTNQIVYFHCPQTVYFFKILTIFKNLRRFFVYSGLLGD